MKIKADDGSSDSDNGLSIGGLAEIGSGMTTFQTGLLYNQFGGKDTSDGDKLQLNLDYLSIPLLGKINFMGDPENTVYMKAGLMPGILVSKEMKVTVDGETFKSSNIGVNSVDVPGVIGLGGTFPVESGNSVGIEANYVRSLSKINNSSDGQAYNEGFIVSAT